MSPPKPKAGVDLVERINDIIRHAVRDSVGTDHGEYYKEVTQILAVMEAYQVRIMTLVDGWHRTALAMQQAAIIWDRDRISKLDEISKIYLDAAVFQKFVGPEK